MLFHVFCEFADGSSKYLHLKTSSMKEAYRQAKRDYYASQVLWIISSLDPLCSSMGLEYTRLNSSKVASEKAALISEFTKNIGYKASPFQGDFSVSVVESMSTYTT